MCARCGRAAGAMRPVCVSSRVVLGPPAARNTLGLQDLLAARARAGCATRCRAAAWLAVCSCRQAGRNHPCSTCAGRRCPAALPSAKRAPTHACHAMPQQQLCSLSHVAVRAHARPPRLPWAHNAQHAPPPHIHARAPPPPHTHTHTPAIRSRQWTRTRSLSSRSYSPAAASRGPAAGAAPPTAPAAATTTTPPPPRCCWCSRAGARGRRRPASRPLRSSRRSCPRCARRGQSTSAPSRRRRWAGRAGRWLACRHVCWGCGTRLLLGYAAHGLGREGGKHGKGQGAGATHGQEEVGGKQGRMRVWVRDGRRRKGRGKE